MNGLAFLVLGIAIAAAIYFFLRSGEGLEQLAAKANSAMIAGRDADAERIFGEIIRRESRLNKTKLSAKQQEANRRSVGHAFLGLGEIIEKRNPGEAFQRYRKARKLGAPLSAGAWKVLGEGYADQHSKSDNAIGAYLAYLREYAPDAASAKVYAALEAVCQVDEDKPAAERQQALELNQRVIAAKPDLEWSYYYLAVACALDGNFAAALTNLERASKLNPDRAMTYYWMGTCHLRQPGGSPDAAIDALSRFVGFPADSPQMAKRQGKAAFDMAKRLIDMIGGFETAQDFAAGAASVALGQAIRYLETAVSKDDSVAAYFSLLARAYSQRGSSDLAIRAFERAIGLGEKQCLYYLGAECLKAGMLDRSRDTLTQAVEWEPESGDARDLLGEVCLRTSRYQEAEAHSREALRLKGWRPAIVAVLLQSLYGQEKLDETIREWEQRPALEAGQEAVFCVARAYSRRGKFGPALAYLERLSKEPRVLYYSACVLAHVGQAEAAQARFSELAAGTSDYAAKALVQSGHILFQAGDLKAAAESYDRAIEKEPRGVEALFARGSLAYREQEMQVAADCFSTLLEAQPGDAQARFKLGLVCEARGDTAGAIEQYGQASEAPDARIRLGVLSCRSEQYAQAAQMLEPLVEAGDDRDAVLFYLGEALVWLNPAKAVEVWGKLLARRPEDKKLAANLSRARYLLGVQMTAQENYTAGAEEFEKYLEQFPADAVVSRDLAELYLREALRDLDNPRVEEWLDRARELDAQNPRCVYYLALLHMKRRQWDRAAKRLGTLPEDARVLYHLGLCHSFQGECEQAMLCFERAMRQEPGGYGRYAAWAIANHHVRRREYAEADAVLAGSL